MVSGLDTSNWAEILHESVIDRISLVISEVSSFHPRSHSHQLKTRVISALTFNSLVAVPLSWSRRDERSDVHES